MAAQLQTFTLDPSGDVCCIIDGIQNTVANGTDTSILQV